MNAIEIACQASSELTNTLSRVDVDSINSLLKFINTKKRIFLSGAGRSLLMLKGFAMRLMHVGFEVYIVGEVTTPAFLPDDLLIVASASGETASLISISEKAKGYGGSVAVFTIFEESSLGLNGDVVVKIPAYTDKIPASEENKMGILPGGSMFEEAVLLLADSIIVELAANQKVDTNKAFENHANLE